jgi:uncharacterized membrane protein
MQLRALPRRSAGRLVPETPAGSRASLSGPQVDEDAKCCSSRAVAGSSRRVLVDILIAIVIVVIAAVLGIVVHPVLWVIIIAAILWLFVRRGRW